MNVLHSFKRIKWPNTQPDNILVAKGKVVYDKTHLQHIVKT